MHVFDRVMQLVSSLIGLAMVALGAVWIMQGIGVGPDAIMRGFMVTDIRWALHGTLLALVGLAQVYWTHTRRSAR